MPPAPQKCSKSSCKAVLPPPEAGKKGKRSCEKCLEQNRISMKRKREAGKIDKISNKRTTPTAAEQPADGSREPSRDSENPYPDDYSADGEGTKVSGRLGSESGGLTALRDRVLSNTQAVKIYFKICALGSNYPARLCSTEAFRHLRIQ